MRNYGAIVALAMMLSLSSSALARTLSQAPSPAPQLGPSATPVKGVSPPNPGNTNPGPVPGWPNNTNTGWFDLTSPQALALLKDKNTVFIDVRAPDEFAAAHYPGAINIVDIYKDPLTNKWNIPNKNWIAEVEKAVPKKDTPILITCWGGGNSRIGSGLLIAAGYTNVSNVYYGFDNHVLWTRYYEDPWGDFKDHAPVLESKLNAVNVTSLTTALKTLDVFPDGKIPDTITTFLLGDEYLVFAARLFGFPYNSSVHTVNDFIDFFKKNETAAGQLRATIVNGIIPQKLSQDDIKKIGLTGVQSILGNLIQFNNSGTTVVTDNYAHSNIYGKVNGQPYSYVVDYPLLPLPKGAQPNPPITNADAIKLASNVKPITVAEAQKYVSDAVAKASSAGR